jgi:hypothetical protein
MPELWNGEFRMNAKQTIEWFHLVFLDHLGRKADKQAWAVKGGCNLRFFFRSVRYSEDMDLDVCRIPVHVLRDTVNGILSSQPFRDILAVRAVETAHVTEAKQTQTTQRWKLGLRAPCSPLPLPTRIEFSRRGMKEGVVFGPVVPELIRAYGLAPILAGHYGAEAACAQKVHALASRSVIQARDLFDLYILLPHVDAAAGLRWPKGITFRQAEERALSIEFQLFKAQVLSYLAPDVQARFDDRAVWDALVLDTLEQLRGLLP